ncbi:hypothetical protein CDAR_592641 [Caerostris darwini]|uniref:Uncharacterized protein n=1 Tax=Caerostris darwini TaxID=1538125 RepID=A0AAV4QH78_9ARAC|nr:hypothetical protein CDAR_592641 [Caerostris darwini]
MFLLECFFSVSLSAGMLLFRPFENGTVPPAVYPVIAGPLKGASCDNRGHSDSKNAPGINEGDKAALLPCIKQHLLNIGDISYLPQKTTVCDAATSKEWKSSTVRNLSGY